MKVIPLSAGEWSHSTSGIRGVSWSAQHGKWRAEYQAGGKTNRLGCFDTAEEAGMALSAARGTCSPKGETLVSDEDYDYLSRFKWQLLCQKGSTHRHAARSVTVKGRHTNIMMSREVAERMGLSIKGKIVRYKDRNSLNNCRSNIALSSPAQRWLINSMGKAK